MKLYYAIESGGIWHECAGNDKAFHGFRSYYLRNKSICGYCRIKVPSIYLLGTKSFFNQQKDLFYTEKLAHFTSFEALKNQYTLIELCDFI